MQAFQLAFRPGYTALQSALCAGLFDAARVLLEAGAEPNAAHELSNDTALLALNMARLKSCQVDGSAAVGMLCTLLDAGADPLLPARHPFLMQARPELAAACTDWLLAAHKSGRRRLSTAGSALALQAAIQVSGPRLEAVRALVLPEYLVLRIAVLSVHDAQHSWWHILCGTSCLLLSLG